MSTGVTGDDAFLRDVVVSSSLGVLVIDSTGLIVFSNGVLEGRLGYGPDDLLDSHLAEVCSTRAPVERVRDAIEASRGAPASVEVVLRDADDGEIQAAATCEADVFDGRRYVTLRFLDRHPAEDDPRSDGSRAVTGRASGTDYCDSSPPGRHELSVSAAETTMASESLENDHSSPYDTAIGTLTTVARDLRRAEDAESAAEIGLGAVERLVGSPVACIRRFHEETNTLERVATTDAAAALVDSRPAFDLDASLAGRAFRRGEPVVDGLPAADGRPQGGKALERASVHVPLGGQGALTVFMPEGVDLVAADVAVVEHLAAVVAAAFARIDPDRNVTDRPSCRGRGGREHPSSFEHPVGEVITDTVGAETEATVRQSVCERLAATDLYSSAWFVDVDVDGEWRSIEASAGATDRAPETLRRPDAGSGDDTVRRAIETDEICLVRRSRTVSTTGPHDDGSHQSATDGENATSETTRTRVSSPSERSTAPCRRPAQSGKASTTCSPRNSDPC
jgi:hypothetical protein